MTSKTTMHFICVALLLLGVPALCQQRGSVNPESHPLLSTQKCTKSSGCVMQNTRVVLDSNYRWIHGALSGSSYTPCFSGSWDPTLCPDPVTCAKNCYLDGVNYTSEGVFASGNSLTLLLFSGGTKVAPRVYLMSDDTHYQLVSLLNQEVSFDVDVSGLPCGTNGALYFTNMAADGGQSQFPNNKAGAYMGTGYCDAQCPQDGKFISGEANFQSRYGNCCHEMDVWEANAAATAMAAHACNTLGPYRCDGSTSTCGTVCDHGGCDFNPYRLGNTSYYGNGKVVNTGPGKLRVITQFKTSDGTNTGALSQIVRTYIRGGKVIFNSASKVSGVTSNSLSDAYCAQEATAFGGANAFQAHGGMASMQKAMSIGMVLTMSIYLDDYSHMLWLDSVFPQGSNPATPGNARGPCAANSGDPATVQSTYPNTQVTFTNIKWGDIDSTYGPPYP